MLCFGLTCSIFSHLLLVHLQAMMIRGMHGQHKFKFWAFSTDSRSSLSMAALIDGSLYFNTHRHNTRFIPAKYWVHRSHMPPSRTSICFLHALTICSTLWRCNTTFGCCRSTTQYHLVFPFHASISVLLTTLDSQSSKLYWVQTQLDPARARMLCPSPQRSVS